MSTDRRPRTTIVRRELRSLTAEKTILLAIVIQLFIAAFSSFLVVGLVSLSDPSAVDGGEMTFAVTGNASEAVSAAIAEQNGVTARTQATTTAATDAFYDGDADAVLEANYTGQGKIQVLATVPENSLRTTQIVAQVRSVLEVLERQQRLRLGDSLTTRPVPMPSEPPNTSPYFGFTYTILVPLLLFLPVFISGSIAVDSITEEIERGTLELLRVAPISLRDIVEGKLVTAVAIAPLQSVLWIGLLLLNETQVSNIPLLLVLVTALATLLVCLGVALAVSIRERRQAQLAYSMTMLVGLGAAVFLPEHPANTIARLAVGSPGTLTYASTAGYVVLGLLAYLVVRVVTERVDPDTL
jgi:ABC-type Na+ efflux pump permease subunit